MVGEGLKQLTNYPLLVDKRLTVRLLPHSLFSSSRLIFRKEHAKNCTFQPKKNMRKTGKRRLFQEGKIGAFQISIFTFSWSIYNALISSGLYLNKIIHHKAQKTSSIEIYAVYCNKLPTWVNKRKM